MKAAWIESYGQDALQLGERPIPQPGANDLLVRVHAASINPIDVYTRNGRVKRLLPYRLPQVLGSDLSGVVEAVGAQVTRFKPGDAIFARLEKMRVGAFAEYAVLNESVAARKPVRLSHVEAASIPLVGLTAHQAMLEIGRLAAGQKVLVQAGSGGVGTFAIQLAKHLGAFVATTVGERNFALVKSLGADQTINYRTERFEELKDFDLVFDTQAGEVLERGFRVLKPGGTIVTIAGLPSPEVARTNGMNPFLVFVLGVLNRKWQTLARRHRVRFEYLFMRPDGRQLEQIAEWLETGTIKPVIDRVFQFEQIHQAFAYSETGRAVGKVVLDLG